jgi:hypothetical protein
MEMIVNFACHSSRARAISPVTPAARAILPVTPAARAGAILPTMPAMPATPVHFYKFTNSQFYNSTL